MNGNVSDRFTDNSPFWSVKVQFGRYDYLVNTKYSSNDVTWTSNNETSLYFNFDIFSYFPIDETSHYDRHS